MSGGGNEIYTAIQYSKSEVHISITDIGIVLPSDKLDKIFNDTDDAEHHAVSAEYGGVVFPMVKKIIEMHHGNISAKCVMGKSITITISLLTGNRHFSSDELKYNGDDSVTVTETECGINENMAIAGAEVELEDIGYDGNAGIRKPEILLVEDNEELCQILKDVLQATYTLHISHNGADGLEMARRLHPDMVICGSRLPGISGKELCYKIKNNVELSDISVIITTDLGSTETMFELLLVGANECVSKPFDVRLLYVRIRNILKNKKRLVAWCGNNVGTVTTEADAISESDRKILKRCIEIIKKNFDNPDFDVTMMSNELCMGRSTFYTKFKQIAGIPPNEFIVKIKLEEAMNMLRDNPELNVSEISVLLGFSSPRYFSKMFKRFFGVTPQSVRK